MISGFASTIFASGFFPLVTSTTVNRMLFPICGAASPTPCAAYIVANMSSTSSSSSPSNLVICLDGFSRTGSPYFTMSYILRVGAAAPGAGAAASELGNLLGISLEVTLCLAERVSPKFLQKSVGQHKRDHRFACHSRCRNDAPVRSLIGRRNGLFRDHIRRLQRTTQRRNRLQVPAHDHILAVRYAAFQPASTIRTPRKLPLCFVVGNLVLHFAAKRTRRQNPRADLHAFHCLNAHHRLRQPPIQLFVPLRVRAQSNRHVVRHNLKHTTHRVARLQHRIHFFLHLFLQRRIHAPQRRFQIPANLLDLVPTRLPPQLMMSHLNRVARNFNPKRRQQSPCKRSRRHSRRCLSR